MRRPVRDFKPSSAEQRSPIVEMRAAGAGPRLRPGGELHWDRPSRLRGRPRGGKGVRGHARAATGCRDGAVPGNRRACAWLRWSPPAAMGGDGEHADQARLLHRRSGRGEQPHHLAGRSRLRRSPTLGRTITAAPACVGMGSSVTCPTAAIIGITMGAGDGADSVTNTTATRPRSRAGTATTRSRRLRERHPAGEQRGRHARRQRRRRLIDARGDRGDVVSCGTATTPSSPTPPTRSRSIAGRSTAASSHRQGTRAASAVPVGRGPSRPGRDAGLGPGACASDTVGTPGTTA